MLLFDLINDCSPKIHPDTMSAIIQTESSVNPYAIAEILPNKKIISYQPNNKEEAINIIKKIERKNNNYSVGISQINKVHFKKFNVTGIDLLEPCINIGISQQILQECYSKYHDVNDTLSCYYSGNNKLGFKIEKSGDSYVHRVHRNLTKVLNKEIYNINIPSIKNYKYVDSKNRNKNIYSKSNQSIKLNKRNNINQQNLKYSSKMKGIINE